MASEIIFLSIPATNCSRERSFSTLKRVKNYLRASMGQYRLNALALLSIKAKLVQEIDFGDITDVFVRTKTRKKKLISCKLIKQMYLLFITETCI